MIDRTKLECELKRILRYMDKASDNRIRMELNAIALDHALPPADPAIAYVEATIKSLETPS